MEHRGQLSLLPLYEDSVVSHLLLKIVVGKWNGIIRESLMPETAALLFLCLICIADLLRMGILRLLCFLPCLPSLLLHFSVCQGVFPQSGCLQAFLLVPCQSSNMLCPAKALSFF